MNIQEIIDKQFNPHNFSKVDLHELFSVFLKNNSLIYKNEQIDYLNSFNKHPLIKSIIEWSKKNDLDLSINSMHGLDSRKVCIISNTASTQHITIKVPNHELVIRYNHLNEDMEKDIPILMISYVFLGSYTKEVYLSKSLNSNIFINVNDNVKFRFKSSTDILENKKTTHEILPYLPFSSNAAKEQIEHNEIFNLIIHSLVRKTPLKEALEIASIQYDFSNKKLINQLTYFFETNQEIEKHCKLASEMKKNNNLIKIKKSF